MVKEKVLITVKTYPTYSKSYEELVCTAGFKEDGTFIRIYPIPYRKLDYDSRFAKYQWIELDLVKNTSDFRPESYRPVNIDNVIPGESIGTDNGTWERRKEICLRKVCTSLDKLIDDAHDQKIKTSLAVFKPAEVIDLIIEKTDREWPREDEIAINKKYLDSFSQKDLYFFLGTTKEHHFVSRNPFIIIGVFYPAEDLQGRLF